MARCAICMDDFPKDKTVDATCAHTYCHACLKQLFTNACLDEQLFPPRCCRREIPVDIALPYLSNKEAEEFLDKTEEYTCDDRTYCFQPSCSKFISAENISCNVASCPRCYFATCTLCKKEEHIGDCPDDPSMKLTLETAAANGWQRCQRCHSIVERSHGCQHMTCRLVLLVGVFCYSFIAIINGILPSYNRCKAEWCYRCGVEWKTCPCGDWDDGQLTRRAEDLAIREVGANSNPQALEALAQEIREELQAHHQCEHLSGWTYSRGGAQCEMCSYHLPEYIFVCSGCRLRACNRCRRNRI